MAKARHDRISELVKEVEGLSKRLRADIRKRASAPLKAIERAAAQLRKVAASVAEQVEKYLSELRKELERGNTAPKKPAKKAKRRAKPKAKAAAPAAKAD